MVSKFTPGPWTECDLQVFQDIDGSDEIICQMIDDDLLALPNHEANARLIAAAPALYEALKGVVEMTNHIAARHDIAWTVKSREAYLNKMNQARAALALVEEE